MSSAEPNTPAEFRRADLLSSADLRRILLRFVVPQNSSVEQKPFCGIPQNSAEIRRISWFSPKWSAEFCGTSAEFRMVPQN